MHSFFPSRTITWYIAKMFLVRTFAVLAVLLIVLQVLDLLGESDAILSYPGNGQAEILKYIGYRLPQLVQRFLPFCVLLGTLITWFTLNQHSEVIAMKAAGLSAHQVLSPLIVASLGIAILSFAFNERIVTRAVGALDTWEAHGFGPVPEGIQPQSNVWVRHGDDLIHAGTVTGSGNDTVLEQVQIYDRTGGKLVSTITGDRATYANGAWHLRNATTFDIPHGSVSRQAELIVAQGTRPDQFTLATVDAAGTSYFQLRQAIADLDQAGRKTAPLRAALWHKISGPLSTLLMPLLGAVAAFGLARSGKLFVRVVIGMALGFAYFVADNFGLAMGNLGAYPPLLAAWGPFVLFLLIGEAVLIQSEERH